jgi:hypothetical protein
VADQLCTPEDLASLLERDDVDRFKAEMLIECATAVVQASCGQRIVRVVDDEVTLDLDDWDGGLHLSLPERPVSAVSAVKIGATTVTDFSTSLRRGSLWRAGGWRSTLVAYSDQPSTVWVKYTHGYTAGDQRLQLARSAVLSLVKGVYGNPSGATQVAIDDYRAVFEAMASQMESSPFLAGLLRKQYGRPPQSVVLVGGR